MPSLTAKQVMCSIELTVVAVVISFSTRKKAIITLVAYKIIMGKNKPERRSLFNYLYLPIIARVFFFNFNKFRMILRSAVKVCYCIVLALRMPEIKNVYGQVF